MEEKLQQLMTEIQNEFGADSNKMFTILILLIFTDKDMKLSECFHVPELQSYINFIEHNKLLQEIFNGSNI